MKHKVLGLAIAAALVGWLGHAAPAQATTSVQYDFTIDHCTNGCIAAGGSAGTLIVTTDGSDLDFLVNMAPNVLVNTGTGLETFAFGMDAAGHGITNLTAGFSVDPTAQPYHEDGFGFFDYGITCDTSRPGDCGSTLSFKLLNFTLADIATGTGGSPNVFAAADIFSQLTGNTGPVGTVLDTCIPGTVGCGGTDVPEPTSLALVGVALTGLGFTRIRRRKPRGNDIGGGTEG